MGGLGGSGRQKVNATGKVYNLNRLSDFSGSETHGVSNGLTLIEGHMHAKLTNQNGVVMYIAGQTEGLAFLPWSASIFGSVNPLTEGNSQTFALLSSETSALVCPVLA